MKFKLFGLFFFCGRDNYGHFKLAVQKQCGFGSETYWAGPMILHYKDGLDEYPDDSRWALRWYDNLPN